MLAKLLWISNTCIYRSFSNDAAMCSVYAVALYSTSVCQKSLVGLESFDPVPTLIREHDQFLYALDLNARECDIHI